MKKTVVILSVLVSILGVGCFNKPSHELFRLGMDPTFVPLDTLGQEANLTGLCQEVFHILGSEHKDQIELLKLSWDDLLPQLKTDRLDGIITTLSPYNFYKKDFLFSEPLIKTGPCVVSNRIKLYKSVQQLEGKIVGIIIASSHETYLKNVDVALQSFDSASSLLDALVRGQIDAALLDHLIAYAYCQDLYQTQLALSTPPLSEAALRFMVKKTSSKGKKLLETFNQFVTSSSLNPLLEKWQLPSS
jgi:polar amino acid transport system substrate-binding protein